ncbi:hypothetical protein SLS56_008140 [Neofusicoccum ribis]|uniref:Uncharacterized protein n=1 Tax=Neofusicoccum ribis TaxID=45134 RepID=A0ABR3SKZ1_9PEZI
MAFSKRAIYDIKPLLLSKVRLVCKHLAQHAEFSEPTNLAEVWAAFTGDIITKLARGLCKNPLASEGCKDNFYAAVMSIG